MLSCWPVIPYAYIGAVFAASPRYFDYFLCANFWKQTITVTGAGQYTEFLCIGPIILMNTNIGSINIISIPDI